ncbi:MAG: MIP/aquaporin family protein [Candidatus Limnocylindrales bacterium]
MNFKKVVAELLGTFLFFTIGYLSFGAIPNASSPAPNLLVVPFAFGLGLLAAIFAFGHISGGHFNPAVTVAMVLDRRTDPVDGIGYIVAQVIGGLLAGLFVMVAVSSKAVAAGTTLPGPGVTEIGALLIETVATAGFVTVFLTSTKRAANVAGLVIPLTLIAIHFATATLSGSSVNPARSLGSAIVGGNLTSLWVYMVGPIAGAVIGWLAWKAVDGGGAEPAV